MVAVTILLLLLYYYGIVNKINVTSAQSQYNLHMLLEDGQQVVLDLCSDKPQVEATVHVPQLDHWLTIRTLWRQN